MKTAKTHNTTRDYYTESKRLRAECLLIADKLKDNPLRFSIQNGVKMDVEITKSDLKTILGKNTTDNKFNAIKNALAKDLKSYFEKASYIGWRPTEVGKHPETAYFVYYSRSLGAKTYLCVRKMKNYNIYKPYAIDDERTFLGEECGIKKGTPPQ